MGIKAYKYKYSNKIGALCYKNIFNSNNYISTFKTVVDIRFFGAKLIGEILWALTIIYGLRNLNKVIKKDYLKIIFKIKTLRFDY